MNIYRLLFIALVFVTGTVSAQVTTDGSDYSDWTASFETATIDDHISLYPNPASNQLTIALPVINPNDVSLQVAIYDLCGNLVKSQNLNDGQRNEVEVATLPNGLYIVNVCGEDFKFSDRLVVQH